MLVRITEYFHAFGPQFSNLKEGVVCETVPAPEGWENATGVWVMGVGEPVRLLRGEYREI